MAAYGEEVALVAYGVIGTCREPGRPVVGLPDDGAQPMDVEGAAGLAGGADVAAEQPLEPARPSPPAPPSRTVRAEPARTVHARADGPRDDLIPRKNLFRDIRLQENPLLAPRVRLPRSSRCVHLRSCERLFSIGPWMTSGLALGLLSGYCPPW